jgi:hypothetical protein
MGILIVICTTAPAAALKHTTTLQLCSKAYTNQPEHNHGIITHANGPMQGNAAVMQRQQPQHIATAYASACMFRYTAVTAS